MKYYNEMQMLFCAEVMLEIVQNVLFIWIHKGNAILLISNLILLSDLYVASLHSANCIQKVPKHLMNLGILLVSNPGDTDGDTSGFCAF